MRSLDEEIEMLRRRDRERRKSLARPERYRKEVPGRPEWAGMPVERRRVRIMEEITKARYRLNRLEKAVVEQKEKVRKLDNERRRIAREMEG